MCLNVSGRPSNGYLKGESTPNTLSNNHEGRCIKSARIEPNAKRESLVVVSTSNKVIIQGVESSLHISDRVRSLSLFPLDEERDAIVVGTDSHLIVYDAHDNVTLFQRDLPDGVNCFAIGRLANYGPLILCGGNCAIWGFDKTGSDVFWTVTGDQVTALALADLDSDGENELIVGSEDHEIRLFKGDLMREEIIESDIIIELCPIKDSLYAYALNNGSVGIYDNTKRIWRTKSKVNVASLIVFPSDQFIACIWQAGKIDIRRIETGEDVMKENFSGQISGAVQSKTSEDSKYEITLVFNDGKVKGMEMEQPEDDSEDPAAVLRDFGQKKHNLLVELNNFEQEERIGIDKQSGELRVPMNAAVDSLLKLNLRDRRLQIEVFSHHNIPIRGTIVLAEGIFQGESYVQMQDAEAENGDKMIIPIYPLKDHLVEMHLHTFIGYPQSDTVHLFQNPQRINRLSRFGLLPSSEDIPLPESKVELLDVEIRPNRMIEWIVHNMSYEEDEPTVENVEELDIEIKFIRLQPCEKSYLVMKIDKGKLTIYTNEMEAMATIIQSMAEFFAWNTVSSHAILPFEREKVNKIMNDMDRMYEVRDRLGTHISEKHSLLKEMIVRAEDAINIDDMNLARKYYTRLRNVERAVRQDYLLGSNNHETLVTSLRSLHKIIDLSSKLRVGSPSRSVVAACREAVSNDNLSIIPKIIEFGAQ